MRVTRLSNRVLGPVQQAPTSDANHVGAWAVIAANITAVLFSSYNIASLTDNGAGSFTLTYQRAFSASDYAVLGACMTTGASFDDQVYTVSGTLPTATSALIQTPNSASANADCLPTCVAMVGRF